MGGMGESTLKESSKGRPSKRRHQFLLHIRTSREVAKRLKRVADREIRSVSEMGDYLIRKGLRGYRNKPAS